MTAKRPFSKNEARSSGPWSEGELKRAKKFIDWWWDQPARNGPFHPFKMLDPVLGWVVIGYDGQKTPVQGATFDWQNPSPS